jgi:hypothetical protein
VQERAAQHAHHHAAVVVERGDLHGHVTPLRAPTFGRGAWLEAVQASERHGVTQLVFSAPGDGAGVLEQRVHQLGLHALEGEEGLDVGGAHGGVPGP